MVESTALGKSGPGNRGRSACGHCGWERAGSAAGAGLTLAERDGVGSWAFQSNPRADLLQNDLLAIQGTLKGLLQHHSSKTSVLQCSAFFVVQLSHPYPLGSKPFAASPHLSNVKWAGPLHGQ